MASLQQKLVEENKRAKELLEGQEKESASMMAFRAQLQEEVSAKERLQLEA